MHERFCLQRRFKLLTPPTVPEAVANRCLRLKRVRIKILTPPRF